MCMNQIPVALVSRTSFSGVNAKALVPEAADQDVAVVGRDHEAVRVDLDALVHQVCDLTLVHARVVRCRRRNKTCTL